MPLECLFKTHYCSLINQNILRNCPHLKNHVSRKMSEAHILACAEGENYGHFPKSLISLRVGNTFCPREGRVKSSHHDLLVESYNS